MKAQKFTIINEGDVYMGGSIFRGALNIKSEVDGPYTSESGYSFTKEDTDKLFSIISLEEFIKLCHDSGCLGMEEFLKKNNIKFEEYLVY